MSKEFKIKVELLHDVFSQHQRMMQTDDYGNGVCCYCGAPLHCLNAVACHYNKRGHKATTWNEMNVNAGHKGCNNKDDMILYRERMIQKHGIAAVDELEMLKNTTMKFTEPELTELIKHYRKENRRLAKEKNFEINLK